MFPHSYISFIFSYFFHRSVEVSVIHVSEHGLVDATFGNININIVYCMSARMARWRSG